MSKTKKKAAKKAAKEAEAGVVVKRPPSQLPAVSAKPASVGARSAEITEALQAKRWAEAIEALRKLRGDLITPKLGSLQRWVRFVDNCFLTMDAEKLQVMHALLYLCNPFRIAPTVDSLDMPITVRTEQVPLNVSSPSGTVQPGLGREDYTNAARLCFERAGPERTPPNRHPLRIWAMGDAIFPCDTPEASVAVPALGTQVSMLTNVLSVRECATIIECGETIGFDADEPLAEQQAVPSKAFVWMCPPKLLARIYERVKSAGLPTILAGHGIPCADPEEVLEPLGLNARFRTYRYDPGVVYRPHFDGAWPSSGFDDQGGYVYDAQGDRRSRITVVIYLNDDFAGGHTTFFGLERGGLVKTSGTIVANGVQPMRGACTIFPHGDTSHVIHEGSRVHTGAKYVVRTEVLYCLPTPKRREGRADMESALPTKKQRRR